MDQKQQAIRIWQAGVDAVDGKRATKAVLDGVPTPDQILAVGKAAAAMASAALEHFGPRPTLVVTKDDHGRGLPEHVQLIEASHPVPDARSLNGGRALREVIEAMAPDSHVLLLVSGGASSLAEELLSGNTLADLEQLNNRLLAEGLDITAMNAERRKLSRIKGGGLLSHFKGAKATVLAISDVPGDDLNVIGSGIGALPDTYKFDASIQIVASNAHARSAAAELARRDGLQVLADEECLHDDFLQIASNLGPRLRGMPPGVMVFGGEPTVVLPEKPGLGGRNQALALAIAREIAGTPGLTVVVGGTDGTDGPTNAAGAVIDGKTWGDGAETALQRADSGSFLNKAGALLVTGPTGTNVMDLVVAIRR
ncbi:glycerate kinase type-2 family protein [Ruegeria atlantica]|uniref:glycerate kinase type-2 family protein n=1 Tax=Ruegeria atlantica TaxID=81569 RepID=UPI00147A2055|nr:DUF4147 domain-containing protein [Ruegeria atlantica]